MKIQQWRGEEKQRGKVVRKGSGGQGFPQRGLFGMNNFEMIVTFNLVSRGAGSLLDIVHAGGGDVK